jgi:cellulose biosynthesis protein BcsQ
MAIIVSVINVIGGVSNAFIVGLMILYFSKHQLGPVLLIDEDYQSGPNSLLVMTMSRKIIIKDMLVVEMEENETNGIKRNAIENVQSKPNSLVIPSDKRLAEMISRIPADILLNVIESAGFSDGTTVVIDTSNSQGMVGMGICAADMVLVPMTMSKQTVKPTMNTLTMAARFHKPLLGIIPTASGEAQWETKILYFWQNALDESPELKSLGGVILPRVPLSKSLIRGAWAKMPFTSHLVPVFDAIYTRTFGKSALPALPIAETLEVVNG